MEITAQPRLLFHGFDVLKVEFDSIADYDGSEQLNISIKPKVFYPEDSEALVKVIFELKIDHENYLTLTVLSVGHFEIKDFETDVRAGMINANAPAIVFPYLRAFISNFTSSLGTKTSTIILPTQFFKGDLEVADAIK